MGRLGGAEAGRTGGSAAADGAAAAGRAGRRNSFRTTAPLTAYIATTVAPAPQIRANGPKCLAVAATATPETTTATRLATDAARARPAAFAIVISTRTL